MVDAVPTGVRQSCPDPEPLAPEAFTVAGRLLPDQTIASSRDFPLVQAVALSVPLREVDMTWKGGVACPQFPLVI